MKGTIQVYADGVLQIICINCAEKYTEQEPFGGVLVDWCCPCCRETQRNSTRGTTNGYRYYIIP